MEEETRTQEELDILYMKRALELARNAAQRGDTPIGALLVWDGQIIAEGFNERNVLKNPLAHAEIEVIGEAAAKVGDWRLDRGTLYVTLEPCPMCAGAIVQARIPRVVIGAMNPKAGFAGSILNVLQEPRLNHQCEVTSGVLEEESRSLMQQFFAGLRAKERLEKEIRKNEIESTLSH